MKNQLHFTASLIFIFTAINTITAEVINFNWLSSVPKSELYDIKVYQNSNEYDIYTHYSEPNLEVDPLHPTAGNGVTGYLQDRSVSYAQFDFTGTIVVEVTKLYGIAASRVEVQPKVLNINPFYFDGRTVKFILKHNHELPPYLSVKFFSDDNFDSDGNGGVDIKNGLLIFANKPETIKPNKNAPGVVVYSNSANITNADIIYFEPGDYDLTQRFKEKGKVGQMPYTKNGQKIYLEGGAFVRGAFNGKGYQNLALYGRGIITGQDLYWHSIRDENDNKEAFCNFMGCDDLYLEGFVVENPTHHTIPSSKRTTIKNIKILGFASNHDGIRPGGGSVIDGIFIKTSDDYDYARDPHVVKNSIFWSAHNGAVGMLGWNNLGSGFAQFQNCAFINNETKTLDKKNTGIMGSVADDGIQLTDNKLENLYIEDKHAYLVNATLETTHGSLYGYLRNFSFKNIITEYPFQLKNGTIAKQKMEGVENNWIEGWTFTNLMVGGVLVTWENYKDYFDIELSGTNGNNVDEIKFVRNITFNSEGSLFQVNVSKNNGGIVYPQGENGKIDCIEGFSQTFNIVPDDGYKIKKVIIDGEEKGRLQTITFNDISTNHTINVEFESGIDYYEFEPYNSIIPKKDNSGLKVFPIPAHDKLTIANKYEEPIISINIYDLSGTKIKEWQISNHQTEINFAISDLTKGQYVLKCLTEKYFYSKLILKL